jgi:hypothetical protein
MYAGGPIIHYLLDPVDLTLVVPHHIWGRGMGLGFGGLSIGHTQLSYPSYPTITGKLDMYLIVSTVVHALTTYLLTYLGSSNTNYIIFRKVGIFTPKKIKNPKKKLFWKENIEF